MNNELQNIIDKYASEKGALVPLLQEVQKNLGYISESAVTLISRAMLISESEIYGVASFYAQFRFTEPAKHNIKVCLGTACHVRGGEPILNALENELGVGVGEITPDKQFEMERVACVGCCALAPVIVVDNEVYGRMVRKKTKEVLRRYGKL
jgi:NADH-quinone oxidoreductase subunit E